MPDRNERVLVVLHSARASGAELMVQRMLPTWQRFQVQVVCLEDGPIVDGLRSSGVAVAVVTATDELRKVGRGRLLRAPSLLMSLLLLPRRIAPELDEAPTLLISNSIKSAIVAWRLARSFKVPHVWWVHDRIDADYFGAAIARLIRFMIGALADAVVVNSEATLSSLPRMRLPALVCPPGIRLEEYDSVGGRADHAPMRITMLGRMAPWKGQALFLGSLLLLQQRGVPFSARLVGAAQFGEDAYVDSLREIADSSDLRFHVHFDGHRNDIPRVLDETDVLVHCSTIPEPFGTVVLEGMAAGCAVVAPNEGGPAEVVADGVTGLLVRPRSEPALADALEDLARSPQRRGDLGRAGRSAALRFDFRTLRAPTEDWLLAVSRGMGLPDVSRALAADPR